MSSHKLSDPNQVEDYLSSFNEISKPCLKHIVNLQDDNVRDNAYGYEHVMLRLFNIMESFCIYTGIFFCRVIRPFTMLCPIVTLT